MNVRLKSLDILRAFALFLVLGRHVDVYPGYNLFWKGLTKRWFMGGWVGVDLFFVLSGFLISGLLFSEHKQFGCISFKRFFIRRGFKIYPPFYFMIILSILGGFNADRYARSNLSSEFFFLQDYVVGIWNHTWSLGVEEKFYCFLPLLLIVLSCQSKKRNAQPFRLIPFLFIFIAAECLYFRVLTSHYLPYNNYTHLFPFHLRMDSLFFGVVISWYYHYYSVQFNSIVRRFKSFFLGAGMFLLMPAFLFEIETTPWICTFGFTFFYIGCGLILMAFLGYDFKPSLLIKAISLIGASSYSIYLWHMMISKWGFGFLKADIGSYSFWVFFTFFYLIISILLGIFMTRVIEFPMLRLRDRLFPSRG